MIKLVGACKVTQHAKHQWRSCYDPSRPHPKIVFLSRISLCALLHKMEDCEMGREAAPGRRRDETIVSSEVARSQSLQMQ